MDETRKLLCDERFARDKERIEKSEKLLEKLVECNIQLTDMAKNHEKTLGDHEKRLDEIEHRPRDWVDKAISGIIAAVVSFLMGVVFK